MKSHVKFNEFGTCWLGEPGTGPAIFTSSNGRLKGCQPGKFFISDGVDGAGVLMHHDGVNFGIRYFDTPKEADHALMEHRSRAARMAKFPEKG